MIDKLAKRPNYRLKEFNYNQNGAYFITIVSLDRKNMFSNLIVRDGVLDIPQIHLSKYGVVIEKYIKSINSTYKDRNIVKYVIMPNHLHFIVEITESGTSGTPYPTNAKIPSLISTLKRFVNKEIGFNIWQRSYYDHVIRDNKDYKNIWNYIDTNPTRWEIDKFKN